MGFPSIVPTVNNVLMDGTEKNLATLLENAVKHYQIKVYYNTLVSTPVNEAVEIRVYDTRLQDGLEFLLDPVDTRTGSLAHKVYKTYVSSKGVRITAKQTVVDGTNWKTIFVEVHQI